MAKYEEKVFLDPVSEEYDVLEDIQEDDFVFVVNSTGQLKGISFPETLGDEDTVDPVVEEIINYLIEKYKLVRPADATLH